MATAPGWENVHALWRKHLHVRRPITLNITSRLHDFACDPIRNRINFTTIGYDYRKPYHTRMPLH